MAIVAHSTIGERPWGRTFAAIAARRFDGVLAITAEGRQFRVGWRGGAVVAADSPLPADAITRVALTGQLVSSSQVGDIMRILAAAPDRSEVDVIAEVARLSPDQVARLRRRAVAVRAMRTFALTAGDVILDDAPPPQSDVAIDARAITYAAIKAHFVEARLLAELAAFGVAFRLRDEAVADLPQYGFGEVERPALGALREALRSPHELEEACPTVEPRVIRTMLYALAAFGAVEIAGAPVTGQIPRLNAATMPPRPGNTTAPPRPGDTPVRGAPTPAPDRAASPTPSPRTRTAPPLVLHRDASSPNLRPPPSTTGADGRPDADAVRALIRERIALLDRGADHFALLGVTVEATPAEVRDAYFALARQLHPDRLTATGIRDQAKDAQRLFAQINAAFGVISNPRKRAEYAAVLDKGGAQAVAAEQAEAEALALKLLGAEEHFRRGEMALRRDQLDRALEEFQQAVALNPGEGEHHALLGWVTFALAPDKAAVKVAVKAMLDRAIALAPRSATPFVYLGRIARIERRDDEAIAHFQKAIALKPGHAEAASELRVLESRRPSKPTEPPRGGGLFGLRKKT
ncbi:MAG: DnaJ domain-containing protein [Deltaproteobacteria bacterium]|nr:DnaJ domain-containing protein [Deltaproteobacteria bacterium]